jgi:VWFA-related protein
MKAIALAILAALIAPQPPPTFRSTTDLVEVDVVVHDKGGAFVSDLSADDFIVEDDGQAQQVDQIYLHLFSMPARRETAAAGSFVPRAERAGTHRTMIVVFDSDHLTASGFKRTRDAALQLFDKQFLDGIDMGGVVVDGRMVNNRLTSVREELVKAVKMATPTFAKTSRLIEERQWPRMSDIEAMHIHVNADRLLRAEVIRRALEDDPAARPEFVESAVDVKATDLSTSAQATTTMTVQVVRALMNGLERVDGRKTILLMTEGFIADEAWPLVRDAVTLAARSNARIYSLDARGLERGLRSVFDAHVSQSESASRMLEEMDFGGDAMNSLAVDTGGFVVRNTNDFSRAIVRIADDSSNYYVLGYRPTTAQDGKFHTLTVKVKRPAVAVRARRGYVATPRPAAALTDARGSTSSPRTEPERSAATETTPMVRSTDADADRPDPVEGRATMTGAVPAQGFRVRPDAGKHVDLLINNEEADAAAKAGWDAYQQGDVAAARLSLGRAAATANAQPWIHYALGMSEYALREFRESAGEWEMVRRAAPDFEPVYFDLVDSYLQLKDHDQAIRVLRAARDRWPQDPEIFNALGVVQTSRGSLDDAIKSFQQAVSIAPKDPVGYFNLGRALEMRYYRSRRYVQQLRSWVSNERDRADALENYRMYVSFGGPFADDAQAGITRLNWVPKP